MWNFCASLKVPLSRESNGPGTSDPPEETNLKDFCHPGGSDLQSFWVRQQGNLVCLSAVPKQFDLNSDKFNPEYHKGKYTCSADNGVEQAGASLDVGSEIS